MYFITFLGIAILFCLFIAILKKVRANKAEKLLENGNSCAALNIYKDLFVESFKLYINEEGDGYVPGFIQTLKKEGKKNLEKIDTILQQNGINIDLLPYEELIRDVEEFSKRKDVMNMKRRPVKQGKVKYKEFFHRLDAFSKSIPDIQQN